MNGYVQKDLKVTEKQLTQLRAISKKYAEKSRKHFSAVDWQKLSREERAKKFAEMNEVRRKMSGEFTKQIEDVLTGEQLEELKMGEVRSRGVNYLSNPRTVERLALSEEQVRKIQENRKALAEATEKLRRESAKKALEILTPEQLAELRIMHEEGYQSLRGQPQP